MNVWLAVLIALLAFNAGFVFRDWLAILADRHRHGGLVDLSAPAARGELDFDWEDVRDSLRQAMK